MFYCPQCYNVLDIEPSIDEKTTNSQKQTGGEDKYNILINKILNDNITYDDIKDISLDKLLKHQKYKSITSKQKKYIYNKIQDVLPKEKKKIIISKPKDITKNFSRLRCKVCQYRKSIPHGTLLYSETNTKKIDDDHKYNNMKHNAILPRTRQYLCPNKHCISHKDYDKREAIFYRDSNTYNIHNICTTCNTSF